MTYLVLDSHFGDHHAFHMVRQCQLHLISKLHSDAALYLPYKGNKMLAPVLLAYAISPIVGEAIRDVQSARVISHELILLTVPEVGGNHLLTTIYLGI